MLIDLGKDRILNLLGKFLIMKVDWKLKFFVKNLNERIDLYIKYVLKLSDVM